MSQDGRELGDSMAARVGGRWPVTKSSRRSCRGRYLGGRSRHSIKTRAAPARPMTSRIGMIAAPRVMSPVSMRFHSEPAGPGAKRRRCHQLELKAYQLPWR